VDRPPAPGYPLPDPPGRSHHRGPNGRGYFLSTTTDGWPRIECERCGRVSAHSQDVRLRYCGGALCHEFLDAVPRPGGYLPTARFSDGIPVAQAVARVRAVAWPQNRGRTAEGERYEAGGPENP
jgi:hypothetical protein